MGRAPAAHYLFVCQDGTPIERSYAVGDTPPAALAPGPPAWLLEARMDWPHPQGPIEFTGKVAAGHEAEAREALGLE